MNFSLRKGPSGPLAIEPDTAGGTLRVASDGSGDVESVAGTTPGQLWFWSGTTSRFSVAGPSNGNVPVWDAIANDWQYSLGASNSFLISAVEFDDPNNSDWAVNALAPAAADTVNPSIAVRRFDDFNEEGVGFSAYTPSGTTSLTLTFFYRAQTAPGAASTVQTQLYRRPQDPNAAVPAWSSALALTPLSVPANAFFQESSQTILLSTLGLSADQWVEYELTRNDLGAGLPGDWDLQWIRGIYT